MWSSEAGTTVAKLRAELWHGRSANSDDVVGVAAGRGHPLEQLVAQVPDRKVGAVSRPHPATAANP